MTSITTQKYWDLSYEKLELVYDPNTILFKDLFNKYLKNDGECLEIGCYPGNYLIYLSNEFNYEANGIDTTPFLLKRLPLHLTRNNVKVGKLYNEDFLTFNPNKKYNLVCSFGFVEHFTNYTSVIEKHTELVKPSGILVISTPNFRKLQYVLHRFLDFENLKRHNLESMNIKKWTKIMQDNNMKVLYKGYYKTADFWTDSPKNGRIRDYISSRIQNLFNHINQRINLPNQLTSPYLICIAQKIEGDQ